MKKFLFSNCAIIQNGLFLVGMFAGLPANMNLSDGQIKYYDGIEGFISREKNTVVDFFDSFQNKVYALDSGEDQLVIWDLINLKCKYIPLGCCKRTWINFVAFERYQSDYYIFPKYNNKIIVFHTDRNETTEIVGYLDGAEEAQCACRVEDSIWVLPIDGNSICCYELSSGKKRIFGLDRIIQDCVHAIFYKGCIYILNMYGTVYQLDLEKVKLEEIVSSKVAHDGKESMGRIVCAGNKLILLPAYGKDIEIIDFVTKKREIYHDYPDDYDTLSTWWKYYGYCEDKFYYYFAISARNYLLKIEKQSGSLIWIKPKIDSLGGKTINFLKKRELQESDYWELIDLMRVESTDICRSNVSYIGNKIYRTILDA